MKHVFEPFLPGRPKKSVFPLRRCCSDNGKNRTPRVCQLCEFKRKLMRHIRDYNQQRKHLKWKYFDSSRRITHHQLLRPGRHGAHDFNSR